MDNENRTPETAYTPRPRKSFLGFITLGLGIFGFFQPVWSVAAIVTGMIDKKRSEIWSTQSRIGFWLGIAATASLCAFSVLLVLIYLLVPDISETIAESLSWFAEYNKMFTQIG